MTGCADDSAETIPLHKIAFFFLLLFVASSFADLRFSVGGKGFFTFSNFEFYGYLMLLALLASACMESFTVDVTRTLSDRLHRWLLLYFSWGLVAAVLTRGAVGQTILIDLKEILPSIIAYFSIMLIINNQNKARLLIGAWTCAGLLNVLLGLSQFFLGGPHPVQPGENALDKLDISGEVATSLVTGCFSHPNLFSQVLMPYFVVFATAWLLSDRKFALKSLKFLLLGAIFAAVLLLTMAKGAMVWSLLGVCIAVAMSRWKRVRSIYFFTGCWLLLIAAMNSVALLLFFQIVEFDSLRTIFSRIQFVITSGNLFMDHPLNALFGGGMRFWPQYASLWASWEYPNAHNVYLNQMLLYGAVGLVLLVSFIVAHVKRGIASVRPATDPLMSPLPYLAAVFAMTGSYFFEPSFDDPIQKFQLFFALAMGFACSRTGSVDYATGTGVK